MKGSISREGGMGTEGILDGIKAASFEDHSICLGVSTTPESADCDISTNT